MTDHLPRRHVLRTAGALGLGAVTAGALTSPAGAEPAATTVASMGSHHGRLSIRKDPFGTTPEGVGVDVYTFSNGRVTVSMLTWGATIQRVETPDRRGRTENISLGFDNLPDYAALSPYFGATIGRYGNRIAKGQFSIDGNNYQIPVNNGENALHGGTLGFDKKVWKAKVVQTDVGRRGRVHLRQPGRRDGLPRHADHHGHVHARLRRRPADRLPRDRHGQADRRQPDQPRLLQPGRRGQRRRSRTTCSS